MFDSIHSKTIIVMTIIFVVFFVWVGMSLTATFNQIEAKNAFPRAQLRQLEFLS